MLYEVNLTVDADAAEAFAAWLGPHIEAICALDGFLGATWYQRRAEDEGHAEDGRVRWTVHYRVRDRDALGDYFRQHAPMFRQDGIDRFGGRFDADRRVLDPREAFGAASLDG